MSAPESGAYSKITMLREWTDGYPDTLSVQVQRSGMDDRAAFVVIAGHSVWLDAQQVAEVILHLAECKAVMDTINARHPPCASDDSGQSA